MIADYSTSGTAARVQQTAQRETAARGSTNPAWQQRFLALLPSIRRHAKLRFRNLSPELREELVQETVARALLDFLRLVERGKEHVGLSRDRWPVTQWPRFARDGGLAADSTCATSHRDTVEGGKVCRSSRWITETMRRAAGRKFWWKTGIPRPAEIAAARIDVREWLKSLPKRDRRLAERLATGETTSGAARIFGITAGRISQLRRTLEASWLAFQQEAAPAIA